MTTNKTKNSTAIFEELSEQAVALFQQGQDAFVSTARAFTEDFEAFRGLFPVLPGVSTEDVKKAIEDGYDFAGRVLDTQKSLAITAIDTLGSLGRQAAKPATARAAS